MKSALLFLALFAALCAATPARAFTQSGGGSYTYPDGTSKFSDPDEQFDDAGSPGKSPVGTLSLGDAHSANN